MAASDDIYLDYYSSESLSSKWNTKPSLPSRRIELIPPNAIDIKSRAWVVRQLTTPHRCCTLSRNFSDKSFFMSHRDQTFSSWVSTSASEGEERVNFGDIIAPWAKEDVSLLDPTTWAFLVRHYNGLPERYSSYRLALNDPYLPVLSAVSSTPNFSIVVVLDLSKCDDLDDSNISRLKLRQEFQVHSIASGSWPVTSEKLELTRLHKSGLVNDIHYVYILTYLDLRETSVSPLKGIHATLNWDSTSILPSRDHLDFFWPQPQSRIPILIHNLESAASSCWAEDPALDDKPKKPWIIHVDRQYPSSQGLHRRAYWKPARPNDHLPWYSYEFSDEEEFVEEGLDFDDYGTRTDSGSDLGSNSRISSSSGSEHPDLSQEEFNPSSPIEPTSSLFGDNELPTPLRMDSTLIDPEDTEATPSNADSSHANESRPPRNDLDQLAAEVIAKEAVESANNVPHFYDPRAQAGLAPPKMRKRRRRYSSASSESYDSDEEREAERSLIILKANWGDLVFPAQKEKVGANEMARRWAYIKASNKPLAQPPNQDQALQHATIVRSSQPPQMHPHTTQAPPQIQDGRAHVRRTPLGRAPRPPGTIIRRRG
ncbi:hypothetical protein RHS01_03855 [Rhizoctonia solani]|uniref:Uncharacterized protein n=1 Tax=Rhizoctonia solani TaxID=456999 RepID=A0A8H7M6Y5_9AGAM|nr:hypothetical protein RHS01_03855 [Rhizoctonia solani]